MSGDQKSAHQRQLLIYEILFRAGRDCIARLLIKDDRRRLGSRSGASEVKQHKWFGKIHWGLLRHTIPPVSR